MKWGVKRLDYENGEMEGGGRNMISIYGRWKGVFDGKEYIVKGMFGGCYFVILEGIKSVDYESGVDGVGIE